MRSHFKTTITTVAAAAAANNTKSTVKERDLNPAWLLSMCGSVRCARDFMCKKASSSEFHVMTIIIKCRRSGRMRSKYMENSSIERYGGLHELNPFHCFAYNCSCTVYIQYDMNRNTHARTQNMFVTKVSW